MLFTGNGVTIKNRPVRYSSAALLEQSTALQKAAVGLRVGGEAFTCNHGKHVSII